MVLGVLSSIWGATLVDVLDNGDRLLAGNIPKSSTVCQQL